MQEVVEQLRQVLPPVIAGTAIGELTGGAINWETIQNKRCRREIPDECFIRSGLRILIVRDPFLNWWVGTLQPARQMAERYAPVPRAGRRRSLPEEAA